MYIKDKIDFPVPNDQRKGQAIFNFLEWLKTKGYSNDQSPRMADPFHIPNEALERLWKEFLKQ